MDGVKCFWSSNCPYYETTTSYGKERVMCSNTDCIISLDYLNNLPTVIEESDSE